ncbi:MAG TPA: histidine triad nucleotide-binding protein [Verrucomicrobiae bacterium]|nr:histidine triad nucleotide-binding protein [Verrucomicrobiae bacterium]
MENCLFCRISRGDIPARKVYEDESVVVIEDIAPAAPVHLLIIPREHIVNCLDLKVEDAQLIGHIHLVAAKIAREKGLEEGFRLVNNNNSGAGQSVFHIHFHLLGGRSLQWPPG